MFTELLTDVEDLRDRVTSLSARTVKLAVRLDALDALTVAVRTYIHTDLFCVHLYISSVFINKYVCI